MTVENKLATLFKVLSLFDKVLDFILGILATNVETSAEN